MAATKKLVPLIYWRPGCIFCLWLRVALLLRRKKAVWTNIRADAAAAARVRSVNDGNETVPTVFVGTEHRTNPSPSWVAQQFV
ncbi:NrdH-redoxin [Rhodococcus fascians]|nr:NrdH-redoxin [Rhodococcus fascians]MBY4021772.1 NrdH-redoxin [Rhodococcus fascians]